MGPALRILLGTVLWSVASGHLPQADPASARVRAQQILSATRIGQEELVPCSRIEGAGQALLDLGQEAGATAADRAVVALRLAVKSARCTGAERLLGVALKELSSTLQVYSPEDALAPARESVDVLRRVDDRPALAAALNTLGNACWWASRYDEALDAFQRSLEISTADGDRSLAARTENNIANVLKARGEYAPALDHLTRALAAFEALGDRPRAAIVLNNIALVHSFWGDNATALEYSGRALALGRAEGDQNVIGKALDTLGDFYRAAGAYDQALKSFQEALRIRTALGQRAGITETTHNIGLVYFSQGEYELAIAAFKRGLRLDHDWKMGDDAVEAEGLRNIGAAAWRLGQRTRAAADFRASLAIVRRTRNRYREAEVLDDLGEMAVAERHLAESSELFEKSLAIRRDIGDQAGICRSLTSLAAARLAAGSPRAALDLARQALESPIIREQPDLLWPAQAVAGRAYRRLHRGAEAKAILEDAIQSIEQIAVGAPGSEGLGLHFFEDKLLPYHELIALSIERHEPGEAIGVAERSKARVLTQLIGSARGDETKLLTDAEKRERGRLRDAVLTLNRQIATEQEHGRADASRMEALEASRHDAREAVDAFETTLATRHPELATAPIAIAPFAVAQAGAIVGDRRTAAVEYVVADDRLYAFLVTRDRAQLSVDARAIDVDRTALTRRIDRLANEIASRDFAFTGDARALYDTLLGPFRARLAGITRLIIVPDGVLWSVPFQALRGPDGFVIEHASVSYAPSLAALREIQRLPKPTGPRTVLAMARTEFGSGLEPLPDAASQVRLIRDIYGADRAAVFVGDAATESRFKSEAPRYAVLHLATHGILEEASPLYSHLVLTPSPDSGGDDGRLEAREIMRLKLTADLVVLAACETGRGRTAPGEGVIGTTWALFAAGARSTVVSQFRVESKSTTDLLVGFHRRLARDAGSKTDALRAAALDLLRAPRYAHPYYWAGFILIGDPD
jgi:CHAT domain-containing protein/Tfp pilus assembly protein PilF